ncbi:putative snare-dependent exocytosis protein [Xylona heveae TC161]|uniref:Putative snare-dependent exocytosis protein n=1 Tax=Xylona heveae (strain CBS 132557 / TC161) TaxID=1328760 RepID=A0A161U8N5_XYLHT|nr:putative snare-dependent exocytosis protein [Xylona heveae TC161]KZF18865.1 putative snare-dependent exocytosis protein [Xylona heveae TC161]
MAHFLRGKQAGIQNDFSSGLGPELFLPDDLTHYGVSSQVSTVAYDPVQSLLAVGTNESKYAGGQIYVYGQRRVCVSLNLSRRASVKSLRFCADKLICLDSKNEVTIFLLNERRPEAKYTPPSLVTALLTDPSMDWMFLGLQNGEIVAYDLDRNELAPFKLPNFWRSRSPRSRSPPIVSLSLHPRDIGKLLIGYTDGAIIFSFKENQPITYLEYELPAGAPGGDADPTSMNTIRRPRLTQALWHPTGTFVLTGHEDSSFAIWDPKDGRLIMARTLQDVNVHKQGAPVGSSGSSPGTFSVNAPLFRIAWCSKQNADDTGILIAGGRPTTQLGKGLTFVDLGKTPNYMTSSWQILSDHFASPKKQHVLSTPSAAEVIDFCLVPRTSPHYEGCHDPIAILGLLSSGEIITLSFPSGHLISPSNQLHVSLSFVHPFINKIALSTVERTRWLGMVEARAHGPQFLKGGAEATHPLRRFERRNIVLAAHADGVIRIWDAGHGDEIENANVVQADVPRAAGDVTNVEVAAMSMSGVTSELAVGLKSGEILVFRWGVNQFYGSELADTSQQASETSVLDIQDRADPSLKEGLLPQVLLQLGLGPVSAIKMTDVGFVGAGFENGELIILDMRGPNVIYQANLSSFVQRSKRSSFLKGEDLVGDKPEWATTIEFGTMCLDGEDYTSLLCFVGTNTGRVATLKILPGPSGGYAVQFAGSTALDDRVVSITPLNIDSGYATYATQAAVANLRTGSKVNGVIVAVSVSGARIFKPTSAKGAHKSWDKYFCDTASVVHVHDRGAAIVGLFGDGSARAYSIPGIKEIGEAKLDHKLDIRRFSDSAISQNGNLFAWAGPSELAVIDLWGVGEERVKCYDKLYNPDALVPARPTISGVQWISGTQYVTPSDMDVLIGGPNRPPSRRMVEEARLQQEQRHLAGPGRSSSASDEGYWAYMQRQLSERAEQLGISSDSMDRLEEHSSGWADDVSKFVSQQKRKAVFGALSSKFGL